MDDSSVPPAILTLAAQQTTEESPHAERAALLYHPAVVMRNDLIPSDLLSYLAAR
jgi:phosphoribosyl-ATP pyrophosphohydrolase